MVTDQRDLDLVGPLWEKLNEHHRAHSPHHARYFARMTFDLRKKELLEKSSNGTMRIDLAKDGNTEAIVGYCISTVSEKKQGEIESIFIEKDYRLHGIGDNFMKKALAWMDCRAVTKRVIAVVIGNEEAFTFYSRHNFYPRVTILQNDITT
jgi:GNAT superfamily N-acetyltransferase